MYIKLIPTFKFPLYIEILLQKDSFLILQYLMLLRGCFIIIGWQIAAFQL